MANQKSQNQSGSTECIGGWIRAHLVASGREMIGDMLVHLVHVLLLVLFRVHGRYDVDAAMFDSTPSKWWLRQPTKTSVAVLHKRI